MNTDSTLPAATLSIDLDDLWSYLRSSGRPGWDDYPSFLAVALPRMLDLLERLDLPCTLFVIGRDARQPEVATLLKMAAESFELASHSFEHAPDLHRADPARLHADLGRTEDVIGDICGHRPMGFRGPSFRVSPTLLAILMERGYDYDASTFPTSVGPLARAYLSMISEPGAREDGHFDGLFGGLREAFAPLRPYRWVGAGSTLIEIPVTTAPFARVPIHGTYLNYLADTNESAASRYFALALALCRARGVAPSFLLHATDFIGGDDALVPRFLPGMKRPALAKLAFIEKILRSLGRNHHVECLAAFAARQGALPERNFAG